MVRELTVDDSSPLFDRKGMLYEEFPSDFRRVRLFTLQIVQKAPPEFKEFNLLEQQISELIKNAIKHGNRCDPRKKLRVWYTFSGASARLVIEDEGPGFQRLEEWNEFHRRRTECFLDQDFVAMADYVSYRTEESDDSDGGNALFAAVEYWDGGMVYNGKRNCVAVRKNFPRRRSVLRPFAESA